MKNVVVDRLLSVKFAEPQRYKHITILPLLDGEDGGPPYLTLDEALAGQKIVITETTQSGSVPELKVRNASDQLVLLLDGEEVIGAKQNRVLNTSILVPAGAELVIPVSCTEQGRWHYASAAFVASDAFLAHKIRSSKVRSVSRSLESSAKYCSNQGEVWDHIQALHEKAHFMSPTHAMADVFTAREEDLRRCLESFPLLPNQNGLVVLINGQVAGLDTLSRPEAFARLHPKLVRSYAIDALLDPVETADSRPPTAGPSPQSADACTGTRPTVDPLAQTKAFLAELQTCEVKPFPSVGCGQDCRLTGPRLVGTALVHDGRIIHSALFRTDSAEEGSSLASMRRRRGLMYE